MNYEVVTTQTYRKALRRLSRSGQPVLRELEAVITLLCSGDALPAKYRDHSLSGNLTGIRECHVQSDLLLMYTRDETVLVLVLINIGSHTKLFKK